METVNISFDITPSIIPMHFNLSVTPLKNETRQQEIIAAVQEEYKPAADYVRNEESEVQLSAEATTYPYTGSEPVVSEANGMLPTNGY